MIAMGVVDQNLSRGGGTCQTGACSIKPSHPGKNEPFASRKRGIESGMIGTVPANRDEARINLLS